MCRMKALLVMIGICVLLSGCITINVLPPTPAASAPSLSQVVAQEPSVLPTGTPTPTAGARSTPTRGTRPEPTSPVEQTSAYQQLPEIEAGVDVTLVASPAHPVSYIPSERIQARERLRVVGTDEDGAYLLVLHGNTLGWIPRFYSRIGTSTSNLAVLADLPSGTCTRYLDAQSSVGEPWVSTISGALIVQGIVYRPQPGKANADAARLEVTGDGKVSAPRITHAPLPGSGDLMWFHFDIDEVQKGSQVRVNLGSLESESLAYEAVFLASDCPPGAEQVAGSQKGSSATAVPPKPTVTPVVIRTESGSTAPAATSMPAPSSTPIPIPTKSLTPRSEPTKSAEWVGIPAGTFTMGSSEADMVAALNECNATEGQRTGQICQRDWFHESQRTVSVAAFQITKYEITNAQYNVCVAAGVCAKAGRGVKETNIRYDPGYFRDNYPVMAVDWYDATNFCRWSGGRLPTEEEWEWAARGSDGRRYPWGNTYDPSKANLDSGYPTVVGSYPADASPYGVMDMAGNVFEWTRSELGGKYIVRGGGWTKYYFRGRVSDRGTILEPTFQNYDVGFRCVR